MKIIYRVYARGLTPSSITVTYNIHVEKNNKIIYGPDKRSNLNKLLDNILYNHCIYRRIDRNSFEIITTDKIMDIIYIICMLYKNNYKLKKNQLEKLQSMLSNNDIDGLHKQLNAMLITTIKS